MKPSDLKREMNEQFRLNHPEIPTEITLSKIRAIKLHLLEIGKELDLEVSSVAHAYVYFEKLIVKVCKKKKKKTNSVQIITLKLIFLFVHIIEHGNKKESKIDWSLLLVFSSQSQ